MDPNVFNRIPAEPAYDTLQVPTNVALLIEDPIEISKVTDKYFGTIHKWFSIISKKRFFDQHHTMISSRPEFALLVLCMKVIVTILPENSSNPKTQLYYTAKYFYLEVETSTSLSILILQAGLLLSLYELGHAIYPAAYLSIGACARYAYALGINRNARTRPIKVLTLVELEEANRIWWAIVLLDRSAPLCCDMSSGRVI